MWYTPRGSYTTCCCEPQHTICEPIFQRSAKCTNDDAHDRHSTRYWYVVLGYCIFTRLQDASSVSTLYLRFDTKAAAVNYWHGWCRYHHTQQHPCSHAPIFEPDHLNPAPSLLPRPIRSLASATDPPPAYSPDKSTDGAKRQPWPTTVTSPSSTASTPSSTISFPSSPFFNAPSSTSASPPPSTIASGDDENTVYNISDEDEDEDDGKTPDTLRAHYEEMSAENKAEREFLNRRIVSLQAQWRARCRRELTKEEEDAVELLVKAERVAELMGGAAFGQKQALIPPGTSAASSTPLLLPSNNDSEHALPPSHRQGRGMALSRDKTRVAPTDARVRVAPTEAVSARRHPHPPPTGPTLASTNTAPPKSARRARLSP
ncbi:hypothetical protein C8F01DRAFT_1111216 [Mycena amicta]|nr:hypothetical protein C8F01DRAFT_1111216 [Mycena amicta]